MLDVARTKTLIDQCWTDEIVPTLVEYIKIPNKSPAFDPNWAVHGYMDKAVALFERWARAKLPSLPGATPRGRQAARAHAGHPHRGPRRGPGHCAALWPSRQAARDGRVGQGYGPWMPRLEGDKLYGRGGADDGYAMFGALSALMA